MLLSELRQTPHLSASSIGDFIECGLLYKFGRIDRIPMEFVADALDVRVNHSPGIGILLSGEDDRR